MGLVAAVLGVGSLGVGQPGGSAILVFSVLLATAGWWVAAGSQWGRRLGILVATAFGVAGAYGVYGLVSLMDDGGISRFNLAVLAVLLLMGTASVVLLAAFVGPKRFAEHRIGVAPRRRAELVAFGLVVGIAASVVFGLWLSTLTDPPCCPSFNADAAFEMLRQSANM